MPYLMFAASLRVDSCNQRLIHLAHRLLSTANTKSLLVNFADYLCPNYDANLQTSDGFPAPATQLAQDLQTADGLIVSVPEYNFSIPGNFKNIIDWISRMSPMPWRGVPILLMSASPSLVGGNRGLWATRMPLEACGAFIHPDMFSLASAYTAFNADGDLQNPALASRLQQLLSDFDKFAKAVKK